MSDNLRQYRAIHRALRHGSPDVPHGHVVRPVTPLAALISGMVGSHRSQLPQLAPQGPNGPKPESRIKRLARWVDNATSTAEVYGAPYAAVLLRPLALPPVVVIIEGRVGGRGCGAWMMPVADTGRALPLGWQVRPGTQGPCPEDRPMTLVEQRHALIPPGAQVVWRGDGAWDGTQFQQQGQEYDGA